MGAAGAAVAAKHRPSLAPALQPRLRLQVNTASADVNLLDELSVDAKAGDGDDGGDGQKAQGDLAARVAAMEAQLSRVAELQVCPVERFL